MNQRDDITRDSKRLSYLLRHGANEARLAMDAAGWASIDDVLKTLRMTRATLDRAVVENTKGRLEMEGGRIRACQGHSLAGVPVTLDALEASWREWTSDHPIWHGTSVDAVPSIAREGIKSIERTHVHLAAELRSKVGKRASVDVMIEVSPTALRARGVRVFESGNGVLLAREVPPECLVGLEAMTRRAEPVAPALRALVVRT